MKIWTCGSSPRSGSWNAWTRIKNVKGASRLSNIWNFFWLDPNDFLSQLVTMKETWLYHYDPETKQQSMDWRHSGSPRLKKFWVQKSSGKVLASTFWDQDGILLIDHLPKGHNINADHYPSLVVHLKAFLKEKHLGKFTKGILFLHGYAAAHGALATQKKLAYLGFQCLDQPPYSPDLASLDYHLFPVLKNNWKVAIFFPTRRSFLPRRPGWTDNFLNF